MASEPATETLPALPSAPGEQLPASVAASPGGEQLPGTRKAAVLMAALGSERAANVMQRLSEDEIESLSLEMAGLSAIAAETTESIFVELAELANGGETGASGGLEFARGVIERALGPERAAELLGRLTARTETPPFDFLQRIPPDRTAALLRSESPQTIALILASLRTALAAQVLARLPERQQPDIALRIARMGETSAQVVEQVEEVIRHKLTAVAEREYSAAGGTKTLAEILNHSDRTTERNVLEKLADEDKELAEEVRGMLFVFEDIVKLEERAVQQVLREADQKDLVLALRGAPENVKEVVLNNMSERGAEMIKEEMEVQPPQRKRDIDAAQSRIVAVVRKLEEAGAIVIAGESEDESEAVV
ncbi:MAG TPA: flagellar motor switch protein FliG [Solirubrobacteraceae bacterium]|nr:flagellar motor switch protein FliG [Solirubrobacteraceae bacterium]